MQTGGKRSDRLPTYEQVGRRSQALRPPFTISSELRSHLRLDVIGWVYVAFVLDGYGRRIRDWHTAILETFEHVI